LRNKAVLILRLLVEHCNLQQVLMMSSSGGDCLKLA
jgi:hypothetical protein